VCEVKDPSYYNCGAPNEWPLPAGTAERIDAYLDSLEASAPDATPAANYVPWTFETMPVAVKVRGKKTRCQTLAQPYSNVCVWLPNVAFNVLYEDLLRDWEQLDGTPCGLARSAASAE
jgi:hypothetical protein